MATSTHLRSSAAAAFVAAAALLAANVHPASARPAGTTCGSARTLAATTPTSLHTVQTRGPVSSPTASYDWPVKPFGRQHPVRAFLDDPRIGDHGGKAFHFGIDVAAPDGTPVYAVEGGTVYRSGESVAVKVGPGHTFGYWHIVPAVAMHQLVGTHELLGYVGPGWGHVHFAERIGTEYVNPLRPGGLGPYTDPLAPTVTEISLVHVGSGGIQILTNAYDTTWPPVPGPWGREPVAPALVQWRATRDDRTPAAWRTAVDFRAHMLDRRLFESIYAPPTAQNHKGKAGIYCFYLSHAWKPADGSYRIEVAASDTRGNRTVARLTVSVAGAGERVQSSTR